MNNILANREIFQKQRIKLFQLKEGDSNSRFFYAQASARKHVNFINSLQNGEGQWVNNKEFLASMCMDYFRNVFSAPNEKYDVVISLIKEQISASDNKKLVAPLTVEEVRQAVFQMHLTKPQVQMVSILLFTKSFGILLIAQWVQLSIVISRWMFSRLFQ